MPFFTPLFIIAVFFLSNSFDFFLYALPTNPARYPECRKILWGKIKDAFRFSSSCYMPAYQSWLFGCPSSTVCHLFLPHEHEFFAALHFEICDGPTNAINKTSQQLRAWGCSVQHARNLRAAIPRGKNVTPKRNQKNKCSSLTVSKSCWSLAAVAASALK